MELHNISEKLILELDEIPIETSTINNVAQRINLFSIAVIRSSINRSLDKDSIIIKNK